MAVSIKLKVTKMAIGVKFDSTEISNEDFPITDMMTLVTSAKVFEPTTKDKAKVNPTVEFVDASTYRFTGQLREVAAIKFVNEKFPTELLVPDPSVEVPEGEEAPANPFTKTNVAFKDGKVTYEVCAKGAYSLTDVLAFMRDNLDQIPEIPEPEPEPEPEAEAEGEEAAEAAEG